MSDTVFLQELRPMVKQMNSAASAVLEEYEAYIGVLDNRNLENRATKENFQKKWKNELRQIEGCTPETSAILYINCN